MWWEQALTVAGNFTNSSARVRSATEMTLESPSVSCGTATKHKHKHKSSTSMNGRTHRDCAVVVDGNTDPKGLSLWLWTHLTARRLVHAASAHCRLTTAFTSNQVQTERKFLSLPLNSLYCHLHHGRRLGHGCTPLRYAQQCADGAWVHDLLTLALLSLRNLMLVVRVDGFQRRSNAARVIVRTQDVGCNTRPHSGPSCCRSR